MTDTGTIALVLVLGLLAFMFLKWFVKRD